MKSLLIFLALVALTASVPVNPTDEASQPKSDVVICASTTPCAWQIYNTRNKDEITNIKNNYCECPTDKQCVFHEDDTSVSSYVFRCRSGS